jgi:hypothetical protein
MSHEGNDKAIDRQRDEVNKPQDNSSKSYEGNIEGWDCDCGGEITGTAVFATGETLYFSSPKGHSYTPSEGEILKYIWLECNKCDWNQAS